MAWPNPSDYVDALQNPQLSLADPDLKASSPERDRIGLPRPRCGNFAAVFRLRGPNRQWAVRCFLRVQADREARYTILEEYLRTHQLPWFVAFDYIERGIRFKGTSYPILKMEWLEGDHLDTYVKKNLGASQTILALAGEFENMLSELRRSSIAHGDLQHGNIMVVNGRLRLVDYDGMYVPGLEAFPSQEIGHVNYQHPARTAMHYGPSLDHFSSWVIYSSLVFLALMPPGERPSDALDECILFRKGDLQKPESSPVFHSLQRSKDFRILGLVSFLETLAYSDVRDIPPLDPSAVPPPRPRAFEVPALPEWLRGHVSFPAVDQKRIESVPASTTGALWVHDHLAMPKPVSFHGPFVFERVTLALLASVFLLTLLGAAAAFAYLALGNASPSTFPDPSLVYSLGVGAAVAASLAPTVLYLAFTVRYRSLPVVADKRKLVFDLRRARDAGAHCRHSVDAAQGSVRAVERNEAKAISDARDWQRKIDNEQQRGIKAIDDRLQRELAPLSSKLRGIGQSEEKALWAELEMLQRQHVQRQLQAHVLNAARIRGIGSVLASRLAASGVATAADIVGVRQSTSAWSQYGAPVIYLETSSGRSIHVDGIGPSKAEALLEWRAQLERSARATQPTTLPADRLRAIPAQFQPLKAEVIRKKAEIERAGVQEKMAVAKGYQAQVQEMGKTLAIARRDLGAQRSKLETDLRAKQDDLARANWKVAALQRQLAAYRNIGFAAYLRRAILGRP